MTTGTPLSTAVGPMVEEMEWVPVPASPADAVSGAPGGGGSLLEIARAAVAGAVEPPGGGCGWELAAGNPWCTLRPAPQPESRPESQREPQLASQLEWQLGSQPPGPAAPARGWRIRLGATRAVAGAVLAAVAEVVARDRCTFRFIADRELLNNGNSRDGGGGGAGGVRSPAGQFITLFPSSAEQFQRLARELRRATSDLPGPPGQVLLSGHSYTMGGGDAGGGRGGRGGSRETAGGEVSGGRHRFRALGSRGYTEPGADDTWQGGGRRAAAGRSGPVEGRGPATGPGAPRPIARRRGGTALLAGRYALTAAVRRTAGQAVFLARDTVEGSAITDVVVKQARADGEAGAVLRHEAALLERLDGHGLVPRPIRLVEQEGSVFLVREHLTGRPLGSWAEGTRLAGGGRPDADWAEVRAVALALIGLVERVHAFGLVLRDLSPGGVLVLPDGSLRLVDLELAAEAGPGCPSSTVPALARTPRRPGYRAPEYGPGAPRALTAEGCRVEQSADLYSLGGLLFLLATGHDPQLADLPSAGPLADRLGRWLALAARTSPIARRLAPAVLGLRTGPPPERWPLTRARSALTTAETGTPRARAGVTGS